MSTNKLLCISEQEGEFPLVEGQRECSMNDIGTYIIGVVFRLRPDGTSILTIFAGL